MHRCITIKDAPKRLKPLVRHAKAVRSGKAPLYIVRLTIERSLDDGLLSVRAQYNDMNPRWITGCPGAWRGASVTWHWANKLDAAYEEAMRQSLF